MKKLFIFLSTLFVFASVSAQDVDSLQTNPLQVQIDSLSVKLRALQYDHDYLRCVCEIQDIHLSLKDLAQDALISANELIIYSKHDTFDWDFYDSAKNKYEAQLRLFNALKESVRNTKEYIETNSLKFSSFDLSRLKLRCNLLDFAVDTADKSLFCHKDCLDYYRKSR